MESLMKRAAEMDRTKPCGEYPIPHQALPERVGFY
jgi:hypothetical protein